MTRDIRESDLKLFRQLYPVARDRLCESVIRDIMRIASDGTKTPHQRYLNIFELVRERNRLLAEAFDNPRRSTALFQLAIFHSHGLLTAKESARFSLEARDIFTLHERI